MLKYLAILCLAANVSSQPNHTSGKKQSVPDHQPPASVTTYTYDANCCTTKTSKKANGDPPTGNTSIERPGWWNDPNWWLVIAATATGGFICWQSWETRKSAKAARRSIEVKEAEFIQWVDVGNWSIKPDTAIDFQLAGEVVLKKPEAVAVRITYSILNNTLRPLFISEVRTRLQFIPSDVCRVWIVSERREVAPKGDYKVIIDTELEGFQVDLYVTNRCAIPAIVEIQFANALGEPASADFTLFVTGGIGAVSSSSKGYVSKQAGDQKGIIDSPAQTPPNPD